MSKRTLLAILLFAVSVLVLSRLDFLVHSTLYDYGLIFSYSWANEYWILYALAYQLVIIPLSLWTRNLYLFLVTEGFVLSATQDLIFFGLWEGWFPSGDWTWMPQYNLFGGWTTANQFDLCLLVNGLVWGFCAFQWIVWDYRLKIKEEVVMGGK